MTRFYIPPDQIPGGIPQSEPTEIAALKMQIQKMQQTLKNIEWVNMGYGDLCPSCFNDMQTGHGIGCKLAILIKEAE